jgi:molecular chaperone DnaK (HSP70)
VLLVGGISRIPLISELLITEVGFHEQKLNSSINADEAVARGAAVLAAQMSNECKVYQLQYIIFPFGGLGEGLMNS